ncbi:MAG: hypothetical protein WAM77_20935 [Xanthobacteraceae bacterium]|jgi:hypothetical protein
MSPVQDTVARRARRICHRDDTVPNHEATLRPVDDSAPAAQHAVGMLKLLTRRMRRWGATTLAAAYALCVLAPTVVFAFGDGSHAVHCLIEDDHGAATIHMQAHAHTAMHGHVAHQHSTTPERQVPPDHSKKADVQCCGLAFTNVLPPVLTEVAAPVSVRARTIVEQPRQFADRTPDRLYKPPIARLSI